jgi:hemolysin activation/secretion protein
MKRQLARLFAGSLLAVAVSTAWSAEPDDGVVRFEITRFTVIGNSLLPQAEIDSALAPFAGQRRDFGDVQRALEALEAMYHARGYNIVTVELPEQELDKGVVQLKVVETKIGRIKVSGNQYFDEANIRHALPHLQEGQTPDLKKVSAGLRLANDSPARKIALKLQSSEQDGEVDAALDVVDENPWKAMLNVDNTGTDSTGKTHVGVVLQHANLWGLDHVASLQYTTTAEKPGKVKVYGLGYHIPLYSLGDAVDLFASYSNVDSGVVTAGVLSLAVSGKGAVYGARYTHNLPKRGDLDSRLVYGVDYKAFKNNVLYLGTQLGNDVTVHPLSVNYVANWASQGTDLGGSATLVHNIPGGDKGGAEDFNRARTGAKARYTALRLSGSYGRSLASDWQLRAIVNAQLTADALIPGEQFGGGGAGSVRGFAEREISNDSGVGANLEAYTPDLCNSDRWQCRVLGFYDMAYVKRNHALPAELTSTTIGSTGLGLRVLMGNSLNLQLDYGHVVQAGATGRNGANRLHVRLGLAY